MAQRLVGRGKVGREAVSHAKAEVFEHRHHVGQDQRISALVDFEAQPGRLVARQAVEAHPARQAGIAGQGFQMHQMADVDRRLARTISVAIGQRERIGIACGDGWRIGRVQPVAAFAQSFFDGIDPAEQHRAQPCVEHGFVRQGRASMALARQHETQLRQRRAIDSQAPVDQPPASRFRQHGGDGVAQGGGHLIARQPDEGEQLRIERARHDGEARARAVDQPHYGQCDPLDIGGRKADQLVMRQAGQRMDQAFAGMAAGRKAVGFHQTG